MEKNQLNFSAPLMPARRYSSPIHSSYEDQNRVSPMVNQKYLNSVSFQKPELTSAEVVKPGSVPFTWEQSPGRAKGIKHLQVRRHEEIPGIPKLPPGRRASKSGELFGFRSNPKKLLSAEVPVLRSHHFSGELNTIRSSNKLSGEINTLNKFYFWNEGMVRWGSSKEETERSGSSETRDDDEEDDDGTFSYAHDTVSQLGSYSVNCSISGLSGVERSNSKQCKIMSNGSKPRDFMMDRFLPAAKAMTLEPAQYASRKQLVGVEQCIEKTMVPRVKTPSPRQNVCHIVPYSGLDIGSQKSEEEDRYDEQNSISVKIKACGFLPWLRSKKFSGLFNRLPDLKSRSKSVLSSAGKVSSLVRNSSWRSSSPKPTKGDSCIIQKKKLSQEFRSCELQKPNYTSTRHMFYSGELQTRSGSPYRSSQRSGSSPYRSESPRSVYHKGVGFLSVPKQVNPIEHNRSRTPQRSRPVHVPKSETAFRYAGGGRLDIMRARGLSGPIICGAMDANVTSKVSQNGNMDMAAVDNSADVQNAFTPPLPKSPSESWLSRKLPSGSPRNSFSNLSFNSKFHLGEQIGKNTASGAKWETIVKSSQLRRDHGLHSQELVTLVPQ